MAKRYQHVADLGQDERVPYSAKPRPARNCWTVVFSGVGGKRVQLGTHHEIRGKTPPIEFHTDAKRLIRDYFHPPAEFSPPANSQIVWADCVALVERTAPHTRAETVRSFRVATKALIETLPDITGPNAVSQDVVTRFKRVWLAKPKPDGKPRSPATLSYYVRALSALTNHLIDEQVTSANHWKGTKVAKGNREKQPAPEETQVDQFMTWLRGRYPDWTALHLFIETKMVTGCRTFDLCQLPTAAVFGPQNTITFPPATTKTKDSRLVHLPADLWQQLRQHAGQTHLWGRLFAEIPQHRKQSNGLPDEFSARTIRYVINNLFREFSDAHPDQPRFKPHGLRRRAVTRVVMATGGNVDLTAQLLGVNPTTARNHYLDAKKALDSKELAAKVADALRPKK